MRLVRWRRQRRDVWMNYASGLHLDGFAFKENGYASPKDNAPAAFIYA